MRAKLQLKRCASCLQPQQPQQLEYSSKPAHTKAIKSIQHVYSAHRHTLSHTHTLGCVIIAMNRNTHTNTK